jgi:hypothetical protein
MKVSLRNSKKLKNRENSKKRSLKRSLMIVMGP